MRPTRRNVAVIVVVLVILMNIGLLLGSALPDAEFSAAGWLRVVVVLTPLVTAFGLGGSFYLGWCGTTGKSSGGQEIGQLTDHRLISTELLARAIDQLSSATVVSRLGGIYLIELIGRDSPALRPAVAEILSAFVRATSSSSYDIEAGRPAQSDIQAAVSVIGRLPGRGTIELRGANLAGLRLEGVDLSGADLSEVNLSNAELEGANLEGANLTGSSLGGASAVGARFTRAILQAANLRGANLAAADLSYSLLSEANLREAFVVEASLRHALLANTNLVDSDLRRSDLTGAFFPGANLTGAHVEGARLDANSLDQEQVATSFGNSSTSLPEGIVRPAGWSNDLAHERVPTEYPRDLPGRG